ncbi:DUF2971 domain-containing protein [Flavobacterium limnophilum]|uniref:DUF2971 domain-containing protein n=1 Tax=Flavobacterium limnophilum TaxID=3003262 RepID=UPI0022AC0932|nr:DUF2971 domain-containing protein [Flavobacterium limnophilum]
MDISKKTITGDLSINKPETNSPYLWKYLDLHRFIYLLTEQKLFFTRLDKLEDPFEGVAIKILRDDAKYSKFFSTPDYFPKSFSPEEKIQLENERKSHQKIREKEIAKYQTQQYVNCWFACDRESMAMWNLYSNRDSVAIRIEFEKSKDLLEESFKKVISENDKKMSILGQEIKYLRLNPFDENLPKQNFRFSGLKKDVSFEYEKEYRFLIATTPLKTQPPFFAVPIEIKKLEMSIIAHPNMESWKLNNLRKLLNMTNLKIDIEKSSTLLRSMNFS